MESSDLINDEFAEAMSLYYEKVRDIDELVRVGIAMAQISREKEMRLF